MSAAVETVPNRSGDWALWFRQISAIFRLEIEKNFLGRRSILIYLIALLPLFPLAIFALVTPPGREWQDINHYNMLYANM